MTKPSKYVVDRRGQLMTVAKLMSPSLSPLACRLA